MYSVITIFGNGKVQNGSQITSNLPPKMVQNRFHATPAV